MWIVGFRLVQKLVEAKIEVAAPDDFRRQFKGQHISMQAIESFEFVGVGRRGEVAADNEDC